MNTCNWCGYEQTETVTRCSRCQRESKGDTHLSDQIAELINDGLEDGRWYRFEMYFMCDKDSTYIENLSVSEAAKGSDE